jgi:hypothetical protein
MKEDEILSPDKLTGREHDDIFDKVMARAAPPRRPWLPIAIAAGIALSVLWLWREEDPYRPKGGEAPVTQLEAACDPCRVGGRLTLAISGLRETTTLTLTATAPNGRRFSPIAEPVRVVPSAPRAFLPVVVVLGDEFATPGRYELRTSTGLSTAIEIAP